MERIYIPAILGGMRITFGHLFRKKTTVQYPEVNREFSDIYRGKHVLKRDDEGRERCTACGLCAVACPAEAITMVAAERKPGELLERRALLERQRLLVHAATDQLGIERVCADQPFAGIWHHGGGDDRPEPAVARQQA